MLLGLDLGTTNVKAVLAKPDGCIVARGSAPVQLFHVTGGGVEQDIEEIWSSTLAAIRKLAAVADLSAVKALGVSAQGGAMQILDGSGRPVGRVISWLDGRGRPYDESLTRRLGHNWFARHTGHGMSAMCVGQLLRLRQEAPQLVRAPKEIGFVGDVIVARLCGRRAHDATSLSIAMLYNPALRSADPDLLRTLQVTERQLPVLVSVRTPAGKLLGDVAEATSLPAGIPVSAAIHDQYASALGAGVVHRGEVMFGAGTAWVLLATTERLAQPVINEAFSCTHVLEGVYGQMLSLANGGSAFGWATELLGLAGRSVRALDRLMEAVPPGGEGLRFWPHLVPGAGAGLAPGTRGRLAGLQLSHKGGHILRGVVEGLAMELARYLRFLGDGGVPTKRLVMTGGAAASRLTPQIVSDATGLPLACATESEMSALGAAMVARGLLEPSVELARISQEMAPPVQTFQPGPDADFYRQLFEEYLTFLRGA